MNKHVFAIACIDADGGIGRAGQIPWSLPSDMRAFVQDTKDCCFISGGVTWDSLPFKPLKGRSHVVVTRRTDRPTCERTSFVDSFDEALKLALTMSDRVAIIGGEDCYRALLHHCDEVRLSIIHAKMACDRFFPFVGGVKKIIQPDTHENGLTYHRISITPSMVRFETPDINSIYMH